MRPPGQVRRQGPPLWARAAALAVVLLAAGCGSPGGTGSSHPNGSAATVTVTARSVPGVGDVLVNSSGYTLYMFEPDGHRQVTCTGVCAATWPPLKLPAGGVPAAGTGVKASLLGADRDPEGGEVVTYNGWPLYTYTGDVQPGQATGQAIDLNGGPWYVLRPSGAPLIPGPQS
jgi:predicted lipoprotein with Yx(FWY)xxD motif